MAGKNYSVLMSVYKKECPDFLRESMQSIFDQTVPTNDFVLICDGPLTNELDKVIVEMQKKFKKRLNVVRLEENHGLGYALSFGVKKCKNELIARMDSDDVAMNDRMDKELEILFKTDSDVVGSNIVEYDETMGTVLGLREVPESDTSIKKYAKKRNPMNHMTVCYKKSAVIESGSYLDMMGFEDYYLWARMIQKKKIFYNIQEPLVKVRAGARMVEKRGGVAYYKRMKIFEKRLKQIEFISPIEYYSNVFIRAVSSLTPLSIRNKFYSKALRKRYME